MHKVKKISINLLKIIGMFIVVSFLSLVIFQRFFPESEGIFGFRTFVIVSESMKPELNIGDVILVRDVEPKDVKVGDNITYKGRSGDIEDMIITHQVTRIQDEENRKIFYTQGVNNPLEDNDYVVEEQMYGVVVHKFIVFSLLSKVIRSTVGFVLFIFLPLSVLFVLEVRDIKKELNERRK